MQRFAVYNSDVSFYSLQYIKKQSKINTNWVLNITSLHGHSEHFAAVFTPG
jgi:hypothetical protein